MRHLKVDGGRGVCMRRSLLAMLMPVVPAGRLGDLERKYKFVGDRLILRSPNSKLEITWERIR